MNKKTDKGRSFFYITAQPDFYILALTEINFLAFTGSLIIFSSEIEGLIMLSAAIRAVARSEGGAAAFGRRL